MNDNMPEQSGFSDDDFATENVPFRVTKFIQRLWNRQLKMDGRGSKQSHLEELLYLDLVANETIATEEMERYKLELYRREDQRREATKEAKRKPQKKIQEETRRITTHAQRSL